MIISEKQIMQLMDIAIRAWAYYNSIDTKKDWQDQIIQLLSDIEDQQSKELKVIE